MNKNFESIKKKSLISAILKSVAVGGSVCLAAAGILLLVFSLTDAVKSLGLGALIGIGCAVCLVCALAAGGLTFFFLRPTDMKVAKRYDDEFALNEKLQTMVAFKGQEGTMIDLQRQNALEILSTLPNPKIKFKRIWQYVASLALSVCIAGSGAGVAVAEALNYDPEKEGPGQTVLPPDKDPDNPDNDLFEYDLFKDAGLVGLIEDVRSSSLTEKLKNRVIDRLEELRLELEEIESKAQMREIVKTAVEDLDGIINAANSFRGISVNLKQLDENLYNALVDSVLVYKTSATPLNTAERVKSFKLRITPDIEIALEYPLKESFGALKVKQEPDNPEDPGLETVLAEYIVGLTEALTAYESTLPATQAEDGEEEATVDLLVEALNTFIKELGNVPIDKGYRDNALWGVDGSGNAIDTAKNNIRKAYDNLTINLNTALSEQCYNCVMDTFVRLRLCEIFDLSASDLPKFNDDLTQSGNRPGEDPGGNTEKDPGGNGSIGTGDTNYGGNDKIYDIDSVGSDPDADPETDGYVHYGDVLDDYYAKVYGKLEKLEVSDDMMKIIENYFKQLYSGKENNKQEENNINVGV